MGIRILLGITLVSLVIVLGASVYAEGQSWEPSTGPRWDASGRTTQDELIHFRFDDAGQPTGFSLDIRGDCDWDERPVRRWQSLARANVPLRVRGGRLRVERSYPMVSEGGWRGRAVHTMDARVTPQVITGTLGLEETWTHAGGDVARCHARHVGFSVPRD